MSINGLSFTSARPKPQPCVSVRRCGVFEKTLAKQNHKSTQVCKTRACTHTCDGWPNRFASQLTSHKKLHTSCIHVHRSLAINLCQLAWGGQMAKTCKSEFNESKRKLSQVNTHQHKWVAKWNANRMQVENLRQLGLTCESIWTGLEIVNVVYTLKQTFKF